MLSADDAPSLVGARFAVLGDGDSSYDDFAGKVDRGQNRVPEKGNLTTAIPAYSLLYDGMVSNTCG